MYISKFQIFNYKSFIKSRKIDLSSGFNIVVGKNNSGKTALIQALSLDFEDKPHLSEETVPSPGSTYNPHSKIEARLRLSKEEILNSLLNRNSDFSISRNKDESIEESIDNFKYYIKDGIEIKIIAREGKNINGKYDARTQSGHISKLKVDKDGKEFVPHVNAKGSPNVATHLARHTFNRFYIFDAQRLNVGQSSIGARSELRSNASNLAEVLYILQGNPHRFERYNRRVREVFPHINHVTVNPIDNKNVEIRIWTLDISKERKDLSIPLSESGTGIGQVMAILYVILNSNHPRVIIIDEPQSFLHPGAMRRLIGIMKEYSQHQYIMTTHSPAVITATDPSTLTLARLEGQESKLYSLDVSETRDLRLSLAEVGARLSDVFGADSILWVEGRTEELCFPEIYEKVAGESLLGTEILGVRHTGDFESDQAEEVIAIYQKLSKGRGLLPPAVGFVFDREERCTDEMNDLRRRGDETIHFTERRMYENYLLHPEAIASVLTDLDQAREEYGADEIDEWMGAHAFDFNTDHEYDSDKWYHEVHGANLLSDLFSDLSNARVAFDKVRHGYKLTEWLIEHDPETLKEIADLIVRAIESGREHLDTELELTT